MALDFNPEGWKVEAGKVVLCNKCKSRPGTIEYIGDQGALAYSHGFSELWCEICVVEDQLAYAKKQADRIPELEDRLNTLSLWEQAENG